MTETKTCTEKPHTSSSRRPSTRCSLCGTNKPTATKCPYCPKIFCLLEDLNEHVVVHSSSFACMVCDEIYDSMIDLTDHVKVHRKMKSWKCQRCGKRFSEESHLDRHTKLHLYGGPRARPPRSVQTDAETTSVSAAAV